MRDASILFGTLVRYCAGLFLAARTFHFLFFPGRNTSGNLLITSKQKTYFFVALLRPSRNQDSQDKKDFQD